jgi:RimJ/RimL family protein N-acetyltransferase
MRICWKGSDPAPVFVGRYQEFSIFFEGRRLFSRRTQELIWANLRRFADVIGPGHNAITSEGWRNTSTSPVCFTAMLDDELVAAAWATHIRTQDGSHGFNLAYAVSEQVQGRGLAKLLAANAFQTLFHERGQLSFVQIQSRCTNIRSVALAHSLGMRQVPEAIFDAVKPNTAATVKYCTYRTAVDNFAATAANVIQERLLVQTNGRLQADQACMEQAWLR